MSMTFSFTWNQDRFGEEIRATRRTMDRLEGWCETLILSRDPKAGISSGEWADAAVDLIDFCDDMEWFIDGLRRRVWRGYTPHLCDAMDMAGLQVLEAGGYLNDEGVKRLEELRREVAEREAAWGPEKWDDAQSLSILAEKERVSAMASDGAFQKAGTAGADEAPTSSQSSH